METIHQLADYIGQPPFLYGAVAGVALVLLVLALLKIRAHPKAFEAFAGEFGTVRVSADALRELIQRYCEEMPEIGRARALIKVKNGELRILIRLRIRSDTRLVGVSGYLQEQIGGIIRKNLGLENIGPVDVMVAGILPVSQKRKRGKNTPDDEAGDPPVAS